MSSLYSIIKVTHKFLSHNLFYPIALSTFLVFGYFVGRVLLSNQITFQIRTLESISGLAAVSLQPVDGSYPSSSTALVVGSDHSRSSLAALFAQRVLPHDRFHPSSPAVQYPDLV